MKLAKSILLGSTSALLAVAGAQAADLPARKAAPVEYVKVCDAYGAGFFYIPGTDTCLKVGGRVRADFAVSQPHNLYSGQARFITATGQEINQIGTARSALNTYGWEARGRVDLDARTQTPWGTVQAVASLRLARTTGVLSENFAGANAGFSDTSANPTLEAAYIRFAGFTFGAARDNFSFMPSTFYGAGHWSSFANGAKQIAYTAVLGGGLSATVAIQDMSDTTSRGVNAGGAFATAVGGGFAPFVFVNGVPTAVSPLYAYNALPQLNGRIDWDQGWGSASVMGAVGQARAVDQLAEFNERKTVWAVGAGVKINLPTIAAGDVLWLNGAYANGMTEYTVNWVNFKGSDTKLNTGGFISNAPSWIATTDAFGNGNLETLKSWNLAAIYTHYWTPEWRHSFLASGGRVEGTNASQALVRGTTGAFGDISVWNLGTQLAWLPTRNFEIGVDILYNRVSQDIRRQNGTLSSTGAFTPIAGSTTVTRESANALTGRLRVERTF